MTVNHVFIERARESDAKPLLRGKTNLQRTITMDVNEPNVNTDEKYISVPLEFVKAVAMMGVDFGYGKYELEDNWIDLARRKVDGVEAS